MASKSRSKSQSTIGSYSVLRIPSSSCLYIKRHKPSTGKKKKATESADILTQFPTLFLANIPPQFATHDALEKLLQHACIKHTVCVHSILVSSVPTTHGKIPGETEASKVGHKLSSANGIMAHLACSSHITQVLCQMIDVKAGPKRDEQDNQKSQCEFQSVLATKRLYFAKIEFTSDHHNKAEELVNQIVSSPDQTLKHGIQEWTQLLAKIRNMSIWALSNPSASKYTSDQEDCVDHWIKIYYDLRPGKKALLELSETLYKDYQKQLEQEKKAKEDAEKEMVDEDGFIIVQAGPKAVKATQPNLKSPRVVPGEEEIPSLNPNAGSNDEELSKVDAKEKKKRERMYPSDFYRFQAREKKRSKIRELQSQFENDKKMVSAAQKRAQQDT